MSKLEQPQVCRAEERSVFIPRLDLKRGLQGVQNVVVDLRVVSRRLNDARSRSVIQKLEGSLKMTAPSLGLVMVALWGIIGGIQAC